MVVRPDNCWRIYPRRCSLLRYLPELAIPPPWDVLWIEVGADVAMLVTLVLGWFY
jgi:hypothetical protein